MNKNELFCNYLNIKLEIKALKEKEARLKGEISSLFGESCEIFTDKYKAKKTNTSRESFKLKDALEVLDRRALSPFISKSSYDLLTVKEIKVKK